MEISVFIPVHNPRPDFMRRVLGALRDQTLDKSRWELGLVDNRSEKPIARLYDLSWHPNSRHLREENLGLTHARVHAFKEASTDLVILVDDDNILDADYLEQALAISSAYPFLGTWSGHIRPEFEDHLFRLKAGMSALLTLRDVKADVWSNDPSHNSSTPWGAGLCIRRDVICAYLDELSRNPSRAGLDLKGSTLLYGGDTDIAFIGCRSGFGKGVFTRLGLTHIISRERCSLAYLCRVARGRGYSEVLHQYFDSGSQPLPERISLRRALAWLKLGLQPRSERSVALAYLRGRRQALRDLSAAKALS